MKLIERIKAWFVREFVVPTKPREPHQFNVGECVRANGGYSFDPQVGVITERLSGGAAYAVYFPGARRPADSEGVGWTYFPDELTRIP